MKNSLGEEEDLLTIHGGHEGTRADRQPTKGEILFANLRGKVLYATMENAQITQKRNKHSDAPLIKASDGKNIFDSGG